MNGFHKTFVALLGTLCLGFVSQTLADTPKALTVDQLLATGQYSQIPVPKNNDPHGQAVWAFAQYHLAPRKAVAQAALSAHEKGDDLGTLVLLLCHRTGSGLLRDRATMHRLNFELRSKLEKKKDHSPVELYMIGQCQPGDETGRTTNQDAKKLFAELDRLRKWAWDGLQKSADLKFAQACQDVALAKRQDPAESFKWHQKAADLGLAAGMRYCGLQLVMGIGVAKDTVKGLELSLKAAKEGDVFAMINLVVFYDQGKDFKIDAEKAQFWLDAAGKTGHWYGLIEQGSSLIEGHYGSKVDRTKGIEALQKSVESGNCDALSFLANIYAKGFGLKQDGKQAVRFAGRLPAGRRRLL